MCGGGGDKPEEMESRKAFSQQAAIFLRDYGRTGYQLENQYIESVQNQFSPENYGSAIAGGMSAAQMAYEPGIADMQSAAFNRGVDPGSGAFMSESESLRAAQARAMGQAGSDAGISNTDLGLTGLMNIAKIGQGQQVDSFQGQMDLADLASKRIRDQARDDFTRSQSLQNTVGLGVGGIAGYGMNQQRYT